MGSVRYYFSHLIPHCTRVQTYSKEAARKLFSKLDVKKRGAVGQEEFVVGCLEEPGLCYTISTSNGQL